MIPEEQKKALDSLQTSARYWGKYRALIAEIFAPLTSGLVDEARIKVGQRVLDIGGEANPFFSAVTDVIDRFVDVPPQDPDAPEAFRFAAPGKLVRVLENAGAKNVI